MDAETIHRRRWATLGVLSLSLVVIGLDNTILNVALPTLVRELGATQSQLQWMVDAYILVFAGLLLTMGALGDRYGRKLALTLGLIVFGLGSVAAAFAGSANALIAARAVMGIGGALIMPSTLSIITNVFTGPERGRAIAAWAAVAGLGIILGPVLGGWLLENYWWGSVFLINVFVVAVAIGLGSFLVPESRDPKSTPLDPVGAGLSIVALVALVYAIIEAPSEGWTEVREVETMHGSTGHSEIRIEDLRVPASAMLGGRGQGHVLGQYRLGPARLAHCMRWIAQAETALDMMVDRSLNRFAHGSLLAEKQGIQWMIADSTMELYQAKLMVLHAAYRIDHGLDFKSEVSMAKHFVANALNRIVDRSIQVHGALGYSTDTPLASMYQHARWARFADGADEVHQMRIAQRTIAAYRDHGTTKSATGDLPI